MRDDTLRYAIAYRNRNGEYVEEYFATYEEAEAAMEELSRYYEVYGVMR